MFDGYNYIEKNGEGAKRRFSSPQAVRAVYEHLSTEDLPDSRRRVKILGLYNGNLPYDPKKLEASAQKNLANINTLGLKGLIDNRAGVILRLESDTANLIELRPIARELAGPDAEKIGRVAAEEFSTMLRENGKFIPALARMNKEADLYGLGPITWPSSLDYCPVALDRAQIRFVGNGPVNSSGHEMFMFESTLTAEYLRFLLDNPEIAEAEGWNIRAVKRWLLTAYGKEQQESRDQPGTEGSTTPAEAQLSYIRRNVLGEDEQFKPFHVIHVFVKEIAWPRGITHIMVPAAETTEEFLFEKPNAYRNLDECFLWFPYSINERYAKEVRGLASYLYAIERTNNRLTCQIIDATFLAASLVLTQAAGTAQAQDLTITEQGRYTFLPAGFQPAQAQVKPDLEALLSVKGALDQMGIASASGMDKGSLGTTGPKLFESGKAPSKAELELQQMLRSRQNEAEYAQRQDVMNKICRQSFIRALRLAVLDPVERVDYPEIDDWIHRCEMRGVTLEMLTSIPQLFTIVACRDLALGADGKIAALDAFVQLYGGTLDESGRRFIARESARLQFGQRDADQIIPEVSRDQAPSDQASFATMENNQMKMGFQVVVGQDQLHWSHIPIHAQLLQEIVEKVAAPNDNTPNLNDFNGDPEQSMSIGEQTLDNIKEDPRKVLGILTMCSKHVQEHLAIGGAQIGMEQQAKQVQKMLRDLRPTTKALNLAVATQERVEQAKREEQEREMQALKDAADQTELEKAKYEIDKKAEIDRYRIDKEDEVARLRLDHEGRRGQVQDQIAADRAARDEARRDTEAQAKIDANKKLSDAKTNAALAVGRFNAVNTITGMKSVSPEQIANPSETEQGLDFSSL